MVPAPIAPDDPGDHGKQDDVLSVTVTNEVEVKNDSGNPLDVNIVGGASSGTEYTEGDVDASITGTAVMWEDAGDTLRPVSVTKPLPVSVPDPISVDDNGGSLTVDGTVTASLPANSGVDIGDVTVNNAGGAAAVNIQDGGNSITVDGPITDAQLRATPVPVSGTVTITDGSGPVTVDGTVIASEAKAEDSIAASADFGIPILGVRNDAAVSKTSADGDYSMIAVDSAGRVGITTLGGTIGISLAPATTGGLSTYRNIDVNNVGQLIKGSAGQLYSLILQTNIGGEQYFKLYNKAVAPTVGTDTPFLTIGVRENAPVQIDFSAGVAFSLGIGIGATVLITDADTTNPALNSMNCNVFYK